MVQINILVIPRSLEFVLLEPLINKIQWQVNLGTQARSLALVSHIGELVGRVECSPIVPVDGDEHDVGLFLENMLCTIAMMDVPIYYCYFGHFVIYE